MSRIGNNPIAITDGVEVTVNGNEVKVKGPKGELTQTLNSGITAKVEDGSVVVTRASESKQHKAAHGLCRALINNMVEGVTNGYKTVQELVGVGYKADVKGQILELNLGYSHNIFFQIPEEVKVSAVTEKGKAPTVTLEGIDKQLVGQVAAKIRGLRPPEPFKGKGVKFAGEILRKKAGKSASA
jgi:large subunit ribosomal protein L6